MLAATPPAAIALRAALANLGKNSSWYSALRFYSFAPVG